MILFSIFKKIKAEDLNTNFNNLADGTDLRDSSIQSTHFKDTGWHHVGVGNNPAFENSYTNYGGSYADVAYRKDAFGFVHLKGLASLGTSNTNIFTLPEGYRPAYRHIFPVQTNNQASRLDVDDTGYVRCTSATNWVSLDGIKFRAGG